MQQAVKLTEEFQILDIGQGMKPKYHIKGSSRPGNNRALRNQSERN